MRRFARSLMVLVLSGLVVMPVVVPAAPSAAADPTAGSTETTFKTPPSSLDGEVVVRLDPVPTDDLDDPVTPDALKRHATTTQADLLRWAERTAGVEVRNTHWLVNAVTLSVAPDADLHEAGDVANVRAVTDAITVSRAPATASSTDHSQNETGNGGSEGASSATYGLSMVDAPAAWEAYDATGEGVTVAVLDSGVDGGHPDIDVDRFRAFDADGDPVDSEPVDPSPQSHGTHVAGTVAGGNASGTHIGVAPDAELAVGGVLTNCGAFGCSGTFDQIIGGMEWAVAEADADVMSMSLGIDGNADAMVEPVRNARAAGTLVVAAAGNAGEGTSGSPGNVYDAVGVGAVNEERSVPSFSGGEVVSADDWTNPPTSWPEEYVVPAVSAPGVDVRSAQGSDGYGELSGTSMATPHVAGVAALVASTTDADADTLADALEETAEKPTDTPAPPDRRDIRHGAGVVAATDAIDSVGPERSTPAAALPPSSGAVDQPPKTDTVRVFVATVERLADGLDSYTEPLSGQDPTLAPSRQKVR